MARKKSVVATSIPVNVAAILDAIKALPSDQMQKLAQQLSEPIECGSPVSLFSELTDGQFVLLQQAEYTRRIGNFANATEALHARHEDDTETIDRLAPSAEIAERIKPKEVNPERNDAVRTDHAKGLTRGQIAKKHQLTRKTVEGILRRKPNPPRQKRTPPPSA